jgi:hypothetical protein
VWAREQVRKFVKRTVTVVVRNAAIALQPREDFARQRAEPLEVNPSGLSKSEAIFATSLLGPMPEE